MEKTYILLVLGIFLFALTTFHILFVAWRKPGRHFWLISEYVYYSIGVLGALASAFSLISQSNQGSLAVETQRLVYEIDNLTDSLRSAEAAACNSRDADGSPSNGDACFAYSMALPVFYAWRRHDDFPIAGIPSCGEITKYYETNNEIFYITKGYQADWVAKYTKVKAMHPLCISEEHYQRRTALGFDQRKTLNTSSISSVLTHISELMPCYYRYCSVLVFQGYEMNLHRIDTLRAKLAEKKIYVEARAKYAEGTKWIGIFMLCVALALRLTKTTADFTKE